MSEYSLLVCQLNVAKFKALLATTVDAAQRRVLATLLAEELSKELIERAAEVRDPPHRPPGPASR